MLAIEIQRGKEPMRQQHYQDELGSTAACTRRLCEAAAYSGVKTPSRLDAESNSDSTWESFLGDSWFTGVKVAEWAAEQGHSYFGALKTSTKCTPFQELIDKMATFPSGSDLVMECKTPKGHDLICIGYKYSARKVLVFLGTKNSGSTEPGEPYIARFPDANGNVAQRAVPRPDVVSRYFNDSNVIDSHNQARQFELALEKQWITQYCWFRVATTLLGMTVTDCWRAYKHAMPKKRDKEMAIKEFTDRMAYDCIHNCHTDIASINGYIATIEDVPLTIGGNQAGDDVSALSAPTTASTVALEHPFKDNPELEAPDNNGKQRPKRRRCRVCTEENKTKAALGEKTKSPLTSKMCFHLQCLERRYYVSGRWVYGVFYCPEHYQYHYAAVLEGNGNV
jgi:hypothetical protein